VGQLRPLYCKYCNQTLLSDDLEKCSGCGRTGGIVDVSNPTAAASRRQDDRVSAAPASDPTDPAAVAALVAQKQLEASSPSRKVESALGRAVAYYRYFKWAVAGVFCIFLGLVLILNPGPGNIQAKWTFDDAVPGLLAILAGVTLLALPLILMFPFRRRKVKELSQSVETGRE
jgi:hypothetical protein